MKYEIGDIAQFIIGSQTLISMIMKIDEKYNRVYIYVFNSKEKWWACLDNFDHIFIGKVHPILVKLWRLDEDINL